MPGRHKNHGHLLLKHFRHWWQVPRQAGKELKHRQVTFLELFYDLVYVVLIARLAHALSEDLTSQGLFNFMFLFVIVWWAWYNGTAYYDLHGQNDIRNRIFVFLQMITVVFMAIFAHDAIGDKSIGFAISYSAFQFILTFLWWRTGVHDPAHAVLSQPYSLIFLISTLVFLSSVFFEAPIRYYMWVLSLLMSVTLPLFLVLQARKNPEAAEQLTRSAEASPSLVERFGLFTIIVLGEVVVAVVEAVSHLTPGLMTFSLTIAGTLVAIGMWWVYFDGISHRPPKKGLNNAIVWLYLHLPLTMGFVVIGATTLNALESTGHGHTSGEGWIMITSQAVVLLCMAAIVRVIQQPDEYKSSAISMSRSLAGSAVFIQLIGFLHLEPIYNLLIFIFVLLLQVYVGVIAWLYHKDRTETTLSDK